MNQPGSSVQGHLDELTLTLIADAEPVPTAATAHLGDCALCQARLATIHAEDQLLTSAFALDTEELHFLQAAALPQHAAASYPRMQEDALARDPVSSILLIITACAVGFTGWMAVAPVFSVWWDYARRLGVTSVLANYVAGSLYHLITNLVVALQTLVSLPVLEASLIVLGAAATLIWLTLIVKPGITTNQVPA